MSKRPKIPKTPSYLSKNRYGTYSFQARIPTFIHADSRSRLDIFIGICALYPTLKPLIRFSLQTRDHSVAVRKARMKMVILDNIKEKFSGDSRSAGRAIELWLEYEGVAAASVGFTDVDTFLGGLDEGDHHLLDMILGLHVEQGRQKELAEESLRLKASLLQESVLASNEVMKGRWALEPLIGDDITLSEVYMKFIDAKVSNQLSNASIAAYNFAISTFVQILNAVTRSQECLVSEIQAQHVRDYVSIFPVIPKNPKANGVTNKMNMPEIIKLVRGKSREQLGILGLSCLAPKTISTRFTIVKEFIRYIEMQQYPIKPGLDAIIKIIGKSAKRVSGKRRRHNAGELKQLFESDMYRLCKFKRASDYWVPLAALYTGATQGELVQLYVEDVYQVDGTWVISINDKGDKRLKNEDGRPRVVPVHGQLIKLGFISFVEKCKEAKQLKLYPDEERNGRDQFSAFSKRFNRYRKKCGVGVSEDDKVDFHSFRHLVAGVLVGHGVEEGIANDIIGHASQYRSETVKTYSEGAFIEVKTGALKKLKYDIDFNYTKLWRKKFDVKTELWI